jgi:hypothetical protein
MTRFWTRLRDLVVFLVGACSGAGLLLVVSYSAVILETSGRVGDVAFLVSIAAFLGSFVSPIALVRFLGRRYDSGASGFLLRGGALVANVVFLIAIGFAGRFVVAPILGDSALGMIVLLDGVFGFVWGGIGATLLVGRLTAS